MRVPLILLVVLLAAMPAAAEPSPACQKNVFVYFDVSTSMRIPRGRVTRLEIFTRAVDELLTHTSDFLAEGDRVRLVTFSRTTDVPFDEEIASDALTRLRAELMRLRVLEPDPRDKASGATDVTLVLADLRESLTEGRTYVILASDLIHDPDNENAENQPARKEAFLQRLADFTRDVPRERLPEIVILDANIAGDADSDVGRVITGAFAGEPLHAESIRVTGLQTVTRQLKRQIGKPMQAAVVLRSVDGSVRLGLRVTNPNAFPVRLLQTRTGNEPAPKNLLIGCGATETVDLSAPAGSRITAEFDVGDAAAQVIPGDSLDIDATGARVVLDGDETGTLLLHVHIRKLLQDDATVDVEVGGVQRTVSIAKGVADEPVTFAIPLSANAPKLRSEETIHARFSVDKKIDLQNAETSSDKRSRADEAPTDGDGRDFIYYICRVLAILVITTLLPAGFARRLFDALIDADPPKLASWPIPYVGAGYAAGFLSIPTYLLSGPRGIAFLNALPTALMAAVFVFCILRFASPFIWARLVEPKGGVLDARTARLRLRRLSEVIWGLAFLTFFAVLLAMASLVPNSLAAAK